MARFGPDKAALRQLRRFRAGRKQTVGLLGGSFNPAHAGHRHIAEEALRRLGVDWIWWLVSPQNPLKSPIEMAPLAQRLASATAMAHHPRMLATAVETDFGTSYSAESLRRLTLIFPNIRFIWLMGADNLAQICRWQSWKSLYARAGVAIFARAPYSGKALMGRAAQKFRGARLSDAASRSLARCRLPAWVFLRIRLHPASATAIRTAAQSAWLINTILLEDFPITASTISALEPLPPKSTPLVEQLVDVAKTSLADGKAESIVVIPLMGKTSIADYMIIASGRSNRQVAALTQNLSEKLKEAGAKALGIEGLPRADWVLVDAKDIIIHIFRPEVRRFYNLEKMWGIELPTDLQTGNYAIDAEGLSAEEAEEEAWQAEASPHEL